MQKPPHRSKRVCDRRKMHPVPVPKGVKTAVMRQIELRKKESISVILSDYVNQGLLEKEIGKKLGVSESCISHWLRKLQLTT